MTGGEGSAPDHPATGPQRGGPPEPCGADHAAIARYYDEVHHARPRAAVHGAWHHRALARRLGVQAGQAGLDVACGSGDWLQAATEAGAAVSGIDLSPVAVTRCRERLPGADIRCGPAERLPFEDEAFDWVTCLGSLEHFLDQPAALQEMRRVLRPRGRLVVLVPIAGFLLRRLGLYGGTHQQAVRETVRPLAEWSAMLNQAGFHVEARWRDLHVLSPHWILHAPARAIPARLALAAMLPLWPLGWQYQVYHGCVPQAGWNEE